MNDNIFWFTARGAGLSAMLMLSLATALGAFGSVRLRSAAARIITQYMHRTAAILGLGLMALHVTTLVLDSKAHVGLSGALVPFAAHYRPNSVALGSIAAYLLLILTATGLARGRLASSAIGARMWRGVHLLAYPMWGLTVLHGLLSGTDRGQTWVEGLDVLCILVVLAAAMYRFAHMDDEPNGLHASQGTPAAGVTARALSGVAR